MDDQILFDRFHEALEIEPRPGAYERMRFAMTTHPAALRSRPAYRMRWTKMGFRIAATVTAAVIAVALIAALLVSHRAPVGNVPAGQDKNITAYQALIKGDDARANNATSNHCQTIQDPGCAAAVVPLDAALQQWIDDLASFPTPPRFAVLDGELRVHLRQAIVELNATVSFQKKNDASNFDLAIGAASNEHDWIDYTATAVDSPNLGVAGKYRDAISFARQALDSCAECGLLPARQCGGASAQSCQDGVTTAEFQVHDLLIAAVSNPVPGALTDVDARVKADAVAADTALLAITNGLLSGDSAMVRAGQLSYSHAVGLIDADALAIASS